MGFNCPNLSAGELIWCCSALLLARAETETLREQLSALNMGK